MFYPHLKLGAFSPSTECSFWPFSHGFRHSTIALHAAGVDLPTTRTAYVPSKTSQGGAMRPTDLSSANRDYVDALYEQYCADPSSVDPEWAVFFRGFIMSCQKKSSWSLWYLNMEAFLLAAARAGSSPSGDT